MVQSGIIELHMVVQQVQKPMVKKRIFSIHYNDTYSRADYKQNRGMQQ
jgi:hypothetical protein